MEDSIYYSFHQQNSSKKKQASHEFNKARRALKSSSKLTPQQRDELKKLMKKNKPENIKDN